MRALSFPPLPGEERKRNSVVIHRAGAVEPDEDAITYEELFRLYRPKRQAQDIGPRTLLEMDRAFRLATEVIAPTLPINQIRGEDVRSVRDLIIALPTNFDKNKAFAGMTAQQAVQANEKIGARTIDYATQVKLFRFFMLPIHWAAKNYHITSVPGERISIMAPKKQGRSEKGRKPFSTAMLELMFSSSLFTGCASESHRSKPGPYLFKDGWYWVPIIGFFTGMRLAEVVQLAVEDVRQQEGVWIIDIRAGVILNTGEVKRIKNEAAERVVPVPDDLLKLGLLDVVNRAEKTGRLFPEIRFGHDGTPSKNFSKFWSRYGHDIGFGSVDHVFHSLLSTAAENCAR